MTRLLTAHVLSMYCCGEELGGTVRESSLSFILCRLPWGCSGVFMSEDRAEVSRLRRTGLLGLPLLRIIVKMVDSAG